MRTTVLQAGANPVYAQQISTPGLGDHSYLVVAGDNAAIIDPQRDTGRFRRQVEASGATLRAVLETHVHNDYVSGGPQLAGDGAVYILPTGSVATMPHEAAGEGFELDLGGGWYIRAIDTPGHTFNHLTYALAGPGGVAAVFTGGSMLVGAVGRSDLLGDALTEELARNQYRSVTRLGNEMPGEAVVSPTHGAGSFCAASGVTDTLSTIATERDQNPVFLARDEDDFVSSQSAGLMLYPDYYAQMAPINRVGAPAPGDDSVPRLSPADLDALDSDAWVLDLRPARAFAAGHIPGVLNIPAGDEMATYAGWVVPWGAPLVLITQGDHDLAHALTGLARIGVDSVRGAVVDGLAGWLASGRPAASHRVATFAELKAETPAHVIDARDPIEHEAGHLAGAQNVHVSQLLEADLPSGTVWTHCQSGYRAAVAGSILARRGRDPVVVLDNFDRA